MIVPYIPDDSVVFRPHPNSAAGFAARAGGSVRRMWRRASGVRSKASLPNQMTRQQLRAAARKQALAEISREFPGERRSERRLMAVGRARREWRPE